MNKNYIININDDEYYLRVCQMPNIDKSTYQLNLGSKVIKKRWFYGSDNGAIIDCISEAIEKIDYKNNLREGVDYMQIIKDGAIYGYDWYISEIEDVIFDFMTSAE